MSDVQPSVTSLPPPPPPPPRSATNFDFARPFAFVFEDPEWVQKILLGGVFVLASVVLVGIFFVYGYLARLVRNVIAGVQYPLPAWDDLGEYFTEGLRLAGVGLCYALPIIVVFFVAFIPTFIAGVTDNQTLGNAAGMFSGCVWCVMTPIMLALGVWLPAALVMVAVERRFSAGFEFAKIWNFIKGNAGNYALAYVVRLVAGFIAQFGIILLCIGIVFTGFWAAVVGTYAFATAYRLSLQR